MSLAHFWAVPLEEARAGLARTTGTLPNTSRASTIVERRVSERIAFLGGRCPSILSGVC